MEINVNIQIFTKTKEFKKIEVMVLSANIVSQPISILKITIPEFKEFVVLIPEFIEVKITVPEFKRI